MERFVLWLVSALLCSTLLTMIARPAVAYPSAQADSIQAVLSVPNTPTPDSSNDASVGILLQQAKDSRLTNTQHAYRYALLAQTRSTQHHDTVLFIRSTCLLTDALNNRGMLSEALAQCHRAAFMAHKLLNPSLLADVYNQYCQVYRLLLVYDSAIAAGKRSQDYALQAHDSLLHARASGNIAQVYVRQQRYSEAMPIFQRVLPVFERYGETQDYVHTLSRIGYLCALQGDHQQALEYYQTTYTLGATRGYTIAMAESAAVMGSSLIHLRQFDQALPHLHYALRVSDSLELYLLKKEVHFHLSQLYEATGTPDEALAHYKLFVHTAQQSEGRRELEIQRYERLFREQEILLRQREAANDQLQRITVAAVSAACIILAAAGILLWRKSVHQRIRAKDEELQLLSAYTSDVITRHDTQGLYKYVSPGMYSLFGYAPQDLLNQDPYAFVHPDDGGMMKAIHSRALQTKQADTCVLRFRAKDGTYRWIEVSLKPIVDTNGTIKEFVISSRDVSARVEAESKLRASEETLRATLHNTPNVAVQWYKEDGTIILWNNASEIMYGWAEQEVMGKTLEDIALFFSPNAAENFQQFLQRIMQTGEIVGPYQYQFRRKDGSTGYGQSTTFAVSSSDPSGQSRQTIGVCMDIDITEQTLAQQLLEQRERQLRALINNTADIIFSIDPEYRLITFNSTFANSISETFGVTIVHGMNVLPILATDDAMHSTWRTWYTRAFQGETFTVEHHRAAADDHIAEVSFNPFFRADDSVEGVAVFYRDITERKRAESALRNSEERLRSVIEAMSEGLVVQDIDHRIVFVNHALATMLEMPLEDLYHTSIFDPRLQSIHEDGTVFSDDERPAVLALRTGTPQKNVTVGLRKQNRSTLWMLVNAHPIVSSGSHTPTSVVVTFTDITRQKETELALRASEERLRSVVEALSEGLLVQDHNDNILFSNESAARTLGLTQDQLYGRSSYDPLWRVVHEDGSPFLPEDRPSVSTLRTGKPTMNVIIGVHKPDGSLSWISTNAQPIHSSDGKAISSVVVTFSDITISKNAELALRANQERLRSIVDTISEGLILQDHSGKVILCNPAASAILGVAEQALLGATSLDFQGRTVHEDGSTFLPSEYPALATLRTGLPQSDVIMGILNTDTSVTWISINARPLFASSEHGQPHQPHIAGVVVTLADITKRRSAEHQLRAREAQLTALIESTTDKIYSLDTHYQLLVCNSAYKQEAASIFGVDVQPGMNVLTLLPETFSDELAGWKASFDRVLAGEQYSLVYSPPFLNEQRFVEIMFNPIRNEEGSVTGVVAFNRDITAIKRAEERLRKSEAELRAVVESTIDQIFSIDSSYRLLTYNTSYALSARQLFGVDIQSGMNVMEFIPLHLRNAPERLAAEHAVWKERFDLCLCGERFSVVYSHQIADEREYFEQFYNPIRNEHDAVVGVVAFTRNITQFKHTEDRLRTSEELLQQTSAIAQIGGWNLDLRVQPPAMTWTETTYAICGIPAATELQFTAVLEQFCPPEQRRFIRQYLDHAVHTSGEFAHEAAYQMPNGKERWLRIVGNAEIANGRAVRLYGTLQDISDQRETERLIQAQLHALETKNAEMERFIYTVSHDLKSPLITIKGFLGMIREDVQEQQYHRVVSDLQRIDNAASKMQHLLEDLLELSRIGRVVNPSERFSLSELLEETVELLHGILSQKRVHVSIQDHLPWITADKARFREVYQNLIENACKFFGDQPQPLIEIGVRHDDIQPILYVRDNGIGIAKEYQETIFGLFDKLDPSTDGTGIGLALVKRIIELHGGRIWVESQPGHGATFCFTCKPDTTLQNM